MPLQRIASRQTLNPANTRTPPLNDLCKYTYRATLSAPHDTYIVVLQESNHVERVIVRAECLIVTVDDARHLWRQPHHGDQLQGLTRGPCLACVSLAIQMHDLAGNVGGVRGGRLVAAQAVEHYK